jgi:hypothetical protein
MILLHPISYTDQNADNSVMHVIFATWDPRCGLHGAAEWPLDLWDECYQISRQALHSKSCGGHDIILAVRGSTNAQCTLLCSLEPTTHGTKNLCEKRRYHDTAHL